MTDPDAFLHPSPAPGSGRARIALAWVLAALGLMILPHAVSSNATITILSQMSITIVFALSYNMLLGQAGMLSFGHAVYMGFGGFSCLHAMNYFQTLGIAVPLPLLPLIAGLFSLGIAALIGSFSTRRSGTVFAMISLGIVELIASLSIIFYSFFQGGGVSGDRTLSPAFMGTRFSQQIDVYYLIVFWTILSAALMYGFSRTPAGRMANAVRDNPERAEFLGYSAHFVRYISFCAAGFFAGVAGGLFALNYELATAENFSLQTSGTILMITFLGGIGYFAGPILGAILFTLLQTVLSLHTDLWQLYVGILFLAIVMFCPSGIAGLLVLHRMVLTPYHLRRIWRPYLATVCSGLIGIVSLCGLLEMVFHLRDTAGRRETFSFLWMQVETLPVGLLIAAAFIAFGGLWACNRSAARLKSVWSQPAK